MFRTATIRTLLGLAIMIGGGVGNGARSAQAQEVDSTPPPPTEGAAPASPDPDQGVADPNAGETKAGAEADDTVMSEEEIARVRAYYNAADLRTRAELSAYYKDLGVDLETIIGISGEQQRLQALAGDIAGSFGDLSFARAASDVLTARAGFAVQMTMPNISNSSGNQIAAWIRRAAVAGEWEDIAVLLGQLPEDSARRVALQLFNTLASADNQLLPEEVLRVALVLPGEPDDVHLAPLGRMLSAAAKRHGVAMLLDQLRAGNRQFNTHDPAARRRTAQVLMGANLYREAYEFLPPLDEARREQDAEVMLSHGVYLSGLAGSLAEGPESEDLRRRAFSILAEVARLSTASPEQVRRAVERNAELMPKLPRAVTDPWLSSLFTDPMSTQIAAEVFAVRATTVAGSASADERTEVMLSLSHAVDIMLRSGGDEELRVPLRVLADAICQEIETTIEQRFEEADYARYQWHPTTRELLRLIRAAPSPIWREAIDTSTATRVSRALIDACITTDDTDRAIVALRTGMARSPGDARTLADGFLATWERYLKSQLSQVSSYDRMTWEDYSSSVLSRGQQKRRLATLREVLDIVQGLGVDAANLSSTAGLFEASHQDDEVYRLEDIETVFGTIDSIPPLTACDLADRMRSRILQYWNARILPPKNGRAKTPTAEITRTVNTGYDAALALLDAAERQAPDLWNVHAVRASVSYDRLQLNKRLGKVEQGRELELTSQAFAAFERAAESYAQALNRGENIESSDIYARWFRAALGASDVSALSAETLPVEDSLGDSQFDRIRAAMQALPSDAAYRHAESFIAEIMGVYAKAPPQAKPRLARSALRVVADHPSAGPLRKLVRFHEELASDEIKLRLVVDGPSEVRDGSPFMALLSVRFTNAVDRSSGGFTQYLSKRSQGGSTTYRDDLEQAIRQAFSKGFELDALHLFDADTSVPHGVIENGESGWLELPLGVLYLRSRDASLDRLPRVEMQVYSRDNYGTVAIVLLSNTPPLQIVADAPPRPVQEFELTQALDARNANDPKRPGITLEITAHARGVIPDLHDVIDGIAGAAPGYEVVEADTEARPPLFVGENPPPPNAPLGYVEPTPELDELGVLRPRIERSWVVHFMPTSRASTGVFTFPTLRAGVDAALVSQYYGATDIHAVDSASIRYAHRSSWWVAVVIVAVVVGLVVVGLFAMKLFRRHEPHAKQEHTPIRRSPSGAVLALRAMQREAAARSDFQTQRDLDRDIAVIERGFFGQPPNEEAHKELDRIVTHWSVSFAS